MMGRRTYPRNAGATAHPLRRDWISLPRPGLRVRAPAHIAPAAAARHDGRLPTLESRAIAKTVVIACAACRRRPPRDDGHENMFAAVQTTVVNRYKFGCVN